MFTGIVHRDHNGTFWFDDRPVRGPGELPRGRAWRGTLWYAPEGIPCHEWARVMGPGDRAFGPGPGKILGVAFEAGRSRLSVWNASAWGVRSRDPNRCYEAINKVRAQAVACGLKLKKSVAATALSLYLDRFNGRDSDHPALRQLPCRWRGMAHAAMHGGPISVLRGGSPYAIQLDVRQAYLAALYQDVPVLGVNEHGDRVGGWRTHRGRDWSRIRKLVGFVDATVDVVGDAEDPHGLPPLPVHLAQGAVFALGHLRGVWTIAQVREAEERGEVIVRKVHQFCYALETRPLFAEVADLFASYPQPLSKRLYTRFWGKLGSRGGYAGEVSEEPRDGEVPAGGLWWRYEGIHLDSHRAAPSYRPDLAAFVSAHNHRRVFSTIRRLEPGSLVACHVDALWTTDLVGATREASRDLGVGGWREKRSGPLRFWGIGCYQHDGQIAASGYNAAVLGKPTPERIEGWIRQEQGGETHRRLLLEARQWSGDPAATIEATSTPLVLRMDTRRSPVEGPSVYDPGWTSGGWMRKGETPSEPLDTAPPASVDAEPSPT